MILCDGCVDHARAGMTTSYWPPTAPTEEEPPPLPEERFGELFKAARILLKNHIEDEDQIIPTLAFANEIGQGVEHLTSLQKSFQRIDADTETWRRKADWLASCYASLRPARVVDGVLILERLSASVNIANEPETEAPRKILINIYAHRRPTEPEHLAALYGRVLSDAGIPHTASQSGQFGFEFQAKGLQIFISSDPSNALDFPHPKVVGGVYRMLLGSPSGDGFARHLATRTRGSAPSADNLIAACVAFYLRDYGEIASRKQIHRLLNEHVLCETHKTLSEEGYSSSATNQLWEAATNVKRVRNPLMDVAHTLWHPRPGGDE